jgi:acetyl esterase/lipase
LPPVPEPDDVNSWAAVQQAMESYTVEQQKPLIDILQPAVSEMFVGGVPVLEVKPKDWQGSHKLLVYIHGGAYTLLSAKSSLANAALMAAATGLKIISIDYTLAPHAKWQQVTNSGDSLLN